ncbi:hypothetical protein FA15DRAFT_628293 [Coprinopsis marcescibilis]|uniref:Hydrophobin n=1 Tax=Coprinopsis marcescibilis TaxID=230819 RepID=A0A5C3KDT4_COPMA|nr:hypothetical protein FA15DRAFT_628293 [Coprinopsis marcescibilis]
MARVLMSLAYGPLALVLLMLALLNVVAAHDSIPASKCGARNMKCCNLISASNDSVLGPVLNTLGVVVGDVAKLVGISCTPLDLLGLTQSKECQGHPLCCEGQDFSGVLGIVSVGCTPIRIGA